MNNFRGSNAGVAFHTNGFLDANAQGLADAYASCGLSCIPDAKPSEDPPPNYTTLHTFAEKATGSGRGTTIDTAFETDWGDYILGANYGAVGYVHKSSADFAIVVVATYATAPLDLLTPGHPTITGTAKVGQVLTAHTGTFSPAGVSFGYVWVEGNTEIGSNSPTYVPQSTDVGKTIRVIVQGTKTGYQESDVSSGPTAKVTLGSIGHPSKPTITGNRNVSQWLTAGLGAWTPNSTVVSIQWLRNGSPIVGQTGDTYLQTTADKGKRIDVRLTGTNAGHTTVVIHTSTGTKTGAPLLTVSSLPTISGSFVFGQTLTALPGTWGPGSPHLSYQWYASGKRITAATHVSYKLPANTVEKNISVKVTGTETGFAATSVSSGATEVSPLEFGGGTPATISAPATIKTGTVLTAHAGVWTPAPTSFAYQWYRNGTSIPHQTGKTYKLTLADKNEEIAVFVEVKRAGYDSTGSNSTDYIYNW